MNNYSQVVSKYLSAVHRMLLNTSRVVLVWMIDLIIYYCFSKDNGEAWDNYSWMQLGGFLFLIAGSALYVRAAQGWLDFHLSSFPCLCPTPHASHLRLASVMLHS